MTFLFLKTQIDNVKIILHDERFIFHVMFFAIMVFLILCNKNYAKYAQKYVLNIVLDIVPDNALDNVCVLFCYNV